MRPFISLALAATVCACSSAASAPQGEDAAALLCDGTESVTLAHTVRGGGPDHLFDAVTNPYGHRFLYVNGRCEYLVGRGLDEGLRQGTLTPDDAAEIAIALRLDQASHWRTADDDGCFDAAGTSLRTPAHLAECVCDCESGSSWSAKAIRGASDLFSALLAQGRPLDGGLDLFAVEDSAGKREVLDWPFAVDAAEVTHAFNDLDFDDYPDNLPEPFPLSAADSALARALREATAAQVPEFTPPTSYARSTGTTYACYVLDRVPAAWVAVIDEFESRTNRYWHPR